MTKLRHFDHEGTARFVTFGCFRALPLLRDDFAKQIFIEELDRLRAKHNFRLFGYVVMPEHVHLVLHPPDGMPMGLVVRELKSCSAKGYFSHQGPVKAGERRVFWQRRCYDHNCRTPETTVEKIKYCHNNPVRRGLVSEPGEWRWSSYGCYHGADDVPLRIDRIEL